MWLNETWLNDRYLAPRWVARGNAIPVAGGIWRNTRYLSGRWLAARWLAATPGAITFDQAGTRAEVLLQGFAGGLPRILQGSGAALTPITGWSGFGPDPGGILDNDIVDGGPLSYNVLTTPAGGTLQTYAGGAFTWTPGAAPQGRYFWTYQLYADGSAQDTGKVTIEYGEVFAEVGVTGFAGTLTVVGAFDQQGTRASVVPTGFAGDLTLVINDQGTSASVTLQGQASTLISGFDVRGDAGAVSPEGNAGFLVGTFIQAGVAASLTVSGFAGTLDVGTFFSQQGTAGQVTVTGFAGELADDQFSEQGTAAVLSSEGRAGFTLFGFQDQGATAIVGVEGFAVTTRVVDMIITPAQSRHLSILPAKDRETLIV